MRDTLSQQLDAAGLLPPWVEKRGDIYAAQCDHHDMAAVWYPQEDYKYACWLLECCGLGHYGLPLHAGVEDIPRAVIQAALVVRLAPVVVQKKE